MNKPASDYGPLENMMMQGLAFSAVMESMHMGLFDALAHKARTAGQVARKFGWQERKTEALLELLVHHGLLRPCSAGYGNTEMASEYLVSSSPFYQGKALALHMRFNASIQADIPGLLRGETDARQQTDDGWGTVDIMEGTAQHGRSGSMQDTVAFIAALPDFSGLRSLCDIGGNHGEYSMALLDRNPHLRGEIVDLPGVVGAANERIARRGYAARLEAVPCDLRTTDLAQSKYDLVLASEVLYAFVQNLDSVFAMIRASLSPGGWFVMKHMNPAGSLPRQYTSCVEFITRMAGYETHFLERGKLEEALRAAGFGSFLAGTAGRAQSGLILAAKAL